MGQAALLAGAQYRGMREVMAGWAAGALLPIAQLVQPLQLLAWQDTLPSGRDLERAIRGALQVGAAGAATAPGRLLPPAPPCCRGA